MKTIAVIVDFKSHEKVQKLIREIRETGDIGVIVVDNTQDNVGFAAGVNKGIKMALQKGADRVLLVNPDIRINAGEIRGMGEMGDIVSPVLKFKRGGKWIYDLGGKVNSIIGRTTHTEVSQGDAFGTKGRGTHFSRRHLCVDYVSGACMMIKREVFEKIGFFDEGFFLYFEDADFCLRAGKAGFKIAVDSSIVAEHQIEEHRITGDRFKIRQNLKSNFLFIRKWVSPVFWPAAFSYLLVRTLREI